MTENELHRKKVSEVLTDAWKDMNQPYDDYEADKSKDTLDTGKEYLKKWAISIVKNCENHVPQPGIKHKCKNEKRLDKKCIACQRDIDRFELKEEDLK